MIYIQIYINIIILIASCYITYTDIRFRKIPDKVTIPLFWTLVILRGWQGSFFYYCIGMILTAGILFLIAYFSNGGIGGGDIKWAAVLAFAVPIEAGIFILFVTQFCGIAYYVFFGRRKKETGIPMAPGFLIGYVSYLLII